MVTLKAYSVTCSTFSRDMRMIYPAQSPGGAKALAFYQAYQGAGYDVRYIDFRAVRAPEFDDVAQETAGKMPWCLGWSEDGEAWGCLDKRGIINGHDR